MFTELANCGSGGTILGQGAAALGRGGTVREPDLGEVHTDVPASAKGKAGKGFSATVPVYFHVVTDGSIGALTSSQIATQITVLGNTFGGGEGGAKTGFSFQLAGVTRTNNAGWFYANPGGTGEHTMKRTLRQGGANALNLYSTTAGAIWAGRTCPRSWKSPARIISTAWCSTGRRSRTCRAPTPGEFDQGETATHEVGHWLNLEHTFSRGCSSKGDYVADTPPSFDSCYTEFTDGQSQRMRDAWLFYRAGG